MEKVVRIFNSFAEADKFDVQARMNLTPEERVQISLAIQQMGASDAAKRRLAPVCRVLELEQS